MEEQAEKNLEHFQVLNTSRSRFNRLQRFQAPKHGGLKQFIGGGEHRIIRGSPLVISETTLMKHLVELRDKAEQGLLEVRTVDGRLVDLESFTAQPPLAPVPVPNRPLDSAARDKNQGVGEFVPQFPGGVPIGAVPGGDAPGGIPGPMEQDQAPAPSAPPSPAALADDDLNEDEEVEFSDPAAAAPAPSKGKKGKR
jgi:hypothetical protein